MIGEQKTSVFSERLYLLASVLVAVFISLLAILQPGLALLGLGLIVASIAALVVSARWPEAFLVLALGTNFLKSAYVPGLSAGEFGATPYMLFTALATVGFLLQIMTGKRRLIIPTGIWCLLLFMTFTTLSILVVQNFRLAIGTYARTVLDWMLFFSLVQMLDSRRRVRQLITMLLIQAVIVVAWGIGAGIQLELTGAPRMSVFFWQQFQKNDFAAYLGLVLVLALATFSVSSSKPKSVVAVLLIFAVPIGWMFTFSRGGFLAIAVCIFAFLALERNKKLLLRALVATFILGLLGLATIMFVPAEARTLAVDGLKSIVTGDSEVERHTDTIEYRLELARAGTAVIFSRPLLGVGFNQWQFYSPLMTQVYDPQANEFRLTGYSIHNRYLLIAANSGLIALAGYLGFLLTVLLSSFHKRQFADAWARIYTNVFIASAVGMQVAMLFAPSVLWEWPVFGILIGISNVIRMEASGEPQEVV